ncbi:YcaO-like family protein [bacterium]|nr:YcaO-like family protein [bacterium]
MLRQLLASLEQPRQLSPQEVPFGEFLRSQGALSWEPPQEASGLAFQPSLWKSLKHPGVYTLEGDGEGGCWRYHYQSGLPCLGCLMCWWMGRHHGSEWWQRLEAWPDFSLSWPGESRLPEAPDPGWLHYLRGGKLYRGRVLPHPDCDCGASVDWIPTWESWVHPVCGPIQNLVERRQGGLWRVSLRLGSAASSGANHDRGKARRAALAEFFERWAALQPCSQERIWVRRLGFRGGRHCWSGLVYLGEVPRPHGQQLSHGLACGPSLSQALQAGFWELLERDALRRWWRAWRSGRATDLRRLASDLWMLPGPVFLAFRGRRGRGAWGSAAGPKGVERARQEAKHNFQVLSRQQPAVPSHCSSFADHAAWGWREPVPRWKEMVSLPIEADQPPCPQWRELLGEERIYWCRLECAWAEMMGWTVVKVLSPSLRGLGIGGKPPFHPFS